MTSFTATQNQDIARSQRSHPKALSGKIAFHMVECSGATTAKINRYVIRSEIKNTFIQLCNYACIYNIARIVFLRIHPNARSISSQPVGESGISEELNSTRTVYDSTHTNCAYGMP